MRKLTREQAIDRCIELWRWVVRTDEPKRLWPEWKDFGNVRNQCFLCEFSHQQGGELCDKCPYYLRFGYHCYDNQSPWSMYCDVLDGAEYAIRFLKQLEELKKDTG